MLEYILNSRNTPIATIVWIGAYRARFGRNGEYPVFEFHAHIQRKEHRQIDKCDIHRDEQCRAEQFLSLKRTSLTHLSF